jgi:hypothetical protein
MTKQNIIDKTIERLKTLPNDKVLEVFDFADFISKRYEEEILTKGMNQIISEGNNFDFLMEEEDVYGFDDLKEIEVVLYT